jgi:hypothetical protein
MIDALLVFGAVAALDAFWTLYIAATGRRAWIAASAWSACIMAASGYAATSYVHNPHLLPAAIAGAFVGTAVTLYPWRRTSQPPREL